MVEINWLDWSKEAFNKAKREKKPVLLNISAVWCHWCHNMRKLTYENSEIIDFINKHFIVIEIDTDERPDINERYNVGGWPTTAILAHDGEIVSAATYVPPEHMVKFLEDAIGRFKKYKSKKSMKEKPSKPLPFDQEYFWKMVKSFYDPVNGGFGLEPKFPHHEILGYVIWRVMKLNDKEAAKMLDFTLSKMLKGEIFDGAGGFFRYATLQNWTIPHFEKMLEDNSRLLAYYLFAYRVFKKEEYLTVANKTLFWLFSLMYDHEKGVFYASQDADEAYCNLPLSERVHREPPAIDRRIFTDCNAAMIMALSEAAIIDPEYDRVALKMLDSLYGLNVRGCVAHCYPAEKPLFLFKDHVYLLLGLLWAFKRTNKLEWKSKAMTVAKALERFYDKKNGGFFDILASKDAVGRLKERKKSVNDNAFAALVLFQLAQVSQESKYVKMAQKSLQAVSSQAAMMGPYAAGYAVAVGELQK